ncbi:MAG: hypothetical protein LBD22_00035 [Spirochaetaceae bacterium]|nr:hypothetical protein [Spirochaetaceae bacterium]
MRKAPRFFCDHCGSEVDAGENRCPSCGRFFAAVRCPQCGFSGEEAAFQGGCPSCGYSSRQGSSAKKQAPTTSKKSGSESWLYGVAIAVLILLLTLLFFSVRS